MTGNDIKTTVLERLKGRLIVSVQAEAHEPFYAKGRLLAMVESVLNGGAAALRLAGASHIRYVKAHYPEVPVIGITKPSRIPEDAYNRVYITPAFVDVEALVSAGADVVAMDATDRERPSGETLTDIVMRTKKRWPSLLLMADVATLAEGVSAADIGFDIVSTTLSGYSSSGSAVSKGAGPDFTLLSALVNTVSVPVILEGRVALPSDVVRAYENAAFSVVVGSAITRPHLITKQFASGCPETSL